MVGDDITITYPASPQDEFGQALDEPAWPDLAGTTVTERGVLLDPVSLAEDPRPARPDYTADRLVASLPYGYRIDATCTVEVLTGPHAGDYVVDGNPAHHRNRFTGWESSCTVQLLRVKG